MHTYGMMVNLTPEQQQEARERLVKFLSDKTDDAHHFTVEGLSSCEASAFTGRGVSLLSVTAKDGWVSKNHPKVAWSIEFSCQRGAGIPCDSPGNLNEIDVPDTSQVIAQSPTPKTQ